MKLTRIKGQLFRYLIVVAIFFSSCTKTEVPDEIKYENYISNEIKLSISNQVAKVYLLSLQVIIPETSVFEPKIKSDVEVHKLIYKTTFKTNNIQASGLVCFPKDAGNYPIICFQNGTNTEHNKCPSENPKNELFTILESVASMGFIVVMPDYIGFGASSSIPHPYLHAESTTNSIVDMLRAVKELSLSEKISAKANKDLFIFGYSQGGWATMHLQKAIETKYPNEFNLVASSCAAGPYNLEFMNDFLLSQTSYPMPYFLAYMMNSYSKVGQFSNPLSDLFNEPYAGKISGLFDGKNSGGTINAALTTKISDLINPDYKTKYKSDPKYASVISAFRANSITAWKTTTPMKLYHGGSDEFIPLTLSQKTLADFKTAGVPESNIELKVFPGYDHPSGVIPVGLSTIVWFLSLKK